MIEANVNGDTIIVCGAPRPSENNIDIPPKTAGKKVIEAGDVVINLEENTPELVEAINRKNNKKEEKEH